MIILLILITSSHDNVWISLGENCCWSLLGLKGLSESLATRISYFYTLFNPKVRAHGFPVLKKHKKIIKLVKNKRKGRKKLTSRQMLTWCERNWLEMKRVHAEIFRLCKGTTYNRPDLNERFSRNISVKQVRLSVRFFSNQLEKN